MTFYDINICKVGQECQKDGSVKAYLAITNLTRLESLKMGLLRFKQKPTSKKFILASYYPYFIRETLISKKKWGAEHLSKIV